MNWNSSEECRRTASHRRMSALTLRMKVLNFLALIGVLAILGSIGVTTFFFAGFFNVAADHPDPDIVNWALVQVRKASIARRATDRPPGSLDDPAMAQAGALAQIRR